MPGDEKGTTTLWGIVVSVIVGGGILALIIQRGCDFADQEIQSNLPVLPLPPRDTDSGTKQFPYKNPSSQKYLVHAATLEILASPPEGPGVGAAVPRHVIRFEPRHFNQAANRYERHIDDLIFDEGESGVIEIELVMPGRRKQVYAKLTLWYGDKGDQPLAFPPQWIDTISGTAEEKAEPATGPDVVPAQNDDTSPSRVRRRGRRG